MTLMLRSEKPLSVIFPLFMEWIAATMTLVRDTTGKSYYPGMMKSRCMLKSEVFFNVVLVAHNGFAFDFPVLFAEVERRPTDLSTSSFVDGNVHFSDTLPVLRKV